MVRSIWCGLSPRPTESEPCGSKSTSSTLRPNSASEAPRLMVVVVLPTPPFWLHIEITRALPWVVTGRGSGRSGIGRPVGPSTTSSGRLGLGGDLGRLDLGLRLGGRVGSSWRVGSEPELLGGLPVCPSVAGGAGGLASGGISDAALPKNLARTRWHRSW